MYLFKLTSHPSRVRGLKSKDVQRQVVDDEVAPFTGAWIEIEGHAAGTVPARTSHPSRVRGLKSVSGVAKYQLVGVAPFTGAWIEIRMQARTLRPTSVAPFTGAWIEIKSTKIIS